MLVGVIYALISSFLFAMYGVFVKTLYKYEINEYVLFLSMSFLSCIFYLMMLFLKSKNPKKALQRLKINKHNFMVSFINCGILGLFLNSILSLIAFKYINNGLQRVISYSSPVTLLLLQLIILKKPFKKIYLMAFLILICGYIFVICSSSAINKNLFLGILFGSLSALVFSVYSIISEFKKPTISNEVYWIYSYFSAFLLSLLIVIFNGNLGQILKFMDPKLLAYIFSVAILCFAAPYYILLLSICKIGAQKANTIISITPLIALGTGALFLGEKTNLIQVIGFVVVLGGIFMLEEKPTKQQHLENS